ncbi:MAG: response regulator transcription factor [Chloroflexi bacterium]|nr:response regulator transcription factor [Chloroflexota bacterium]
MQRGIVDIVSPGEGQVVEVVTKVKKTRLYIMEEQEILREAYKAFFSFEPGIEVVGLSDSLEPDTLASTVATLKPDVLLIGTKVLQASFIDKLETLREKLPRVGIVLLSALYDVKGIKRLRAFAKKSGTGCAYLFKHSVDTISQMTQVVMAVAQGRVILDPVVMEGLIESGESKAASFLKELSPRELEVLNWMAKGFKNQAIADILCVDGKTVERHINSIYSKLSPTSESKHPRVNAITLYLKATGQLPSDEMAED